MYINPQAIVFWIFTTGIGYLIGETVYSAMIGLVVGTGISLLADLLPGK